MERRFQLVLAFETTFYRTNARPVVSLMFSGGNLPETILEDHDVVLHNHDTSDRQEIANPKGLVYISDMPSF
jgi:hypothetical protein